ncbi:ParB/RepB/Spo0J family partition protein [uncultured Thiodictyon sp.]|uniref:ParB/RepB/Spo0J family partition protein n=1 Tax=uncultured Thiodictyon sp. TaxID=1846217 RepID=UPI0025F261E0|nr:ParB/RepB/Spo0J family partition protein [uncultured Thiodictyon sp.]
MTAKGSTGEMFKALAGGRVTASEPAQPLPPDVPQRGVSAPNVGILAGREGAIWEVSSGKKITRVVRRVDPDRCRIWARHNRRYDLLSPESCGDLIEGFRQQGGQEFPAIVRRVAGGSDHEYEVISGARRHWTARFLKYDFLIEERELTDLEAFRLSDIENRHRLDLSDFERAVDYLQALDLYYEGSQKQMAMNLERSEGWLSRYLDLARLESAVVMAVRDVREITVNQARVIKPLLSGRTRATVIEKAQELAGWSEKPSAPDLVRILTSAAAEPKGIKATATLETVSAKDSGKVCAVVRRHGRGGLVIQVDGKSGADTAEVVAALTAIVERHYAPSK